MVAAAVGKMEIAGVVVIKAVVVAIVVWDVVAEVTVVDVEVVVVVVVAKEEVEIVVVGTIVVVEAPIAEVLMLAELCEFVAEVCDSLFCRALMNEAIDKPSTKTVRIATATTAKVK